MKYLTLANTLAIIIFSIGIGFYYFFREPTILADYLGIKDYHTVSQYTVYFNSFPSFAHVFSFSLFTWSVLEKSYGHSSILFWSILNSVFEIGQMIDIQYLTWFPKLIQEYCIHGTYSHCDMTAIFLGAICAKGIMYLKQIHQNNHVKNRSYSQKNTPAKISTLFL